MQTSVLDASSVGITLAELCKGAKPTRSEPAADRLRALSRSEARDRRRRLRRAVPTAAANTNDQKFFISETREGDSARFLFRLRYRKSSRWASRPGAPHSSSVRRSSASAASRQRTSQRRLSSPQCAPCMRFSLVCPTPGCESLRHGSAASPTQVNQEPATGTRALPFVICAPNLCGGVARGGRLSHAPSKQWPHPRRSLAFPVPWRIAKIRRLDPRRQRGRELGVAAFQFPLDIHQ